MTRPLPWHDTPTCKEMRFLTSVPPGPCNGPIMMDREGGVLPRCGACGARFRPAPEEAAQIERAEAAWNLVLTGKVHEDKACARCGGVLPIEQERLCPGCVTADMNERQGVLL